MSQVIQNTPQEFWRPPSPMLSHDAGLSEAAPAIAVACPGCGTEFLFGSRFCHTCGVRRPEVMSAATRADVAAIAGLWQQGVTWTHSTLKSIPWNRFKAPAWIRYLHYHEIQQQTGLSTGSLIAFVIGLSCVFGALLVGFLTAKTYVDWQAIQFYRGEWLLAATAAFVAGILLKKPSQPRD